MTSPNLPDWSEQTLLNDDSEIVRIEKKSELTFTYDPHPPIGLFDVSSEDKEEGKERNKQPVLSTWDISVPLKTLAKNRNAESVNHVVAYCLEVAAIHEIQVPTGYSPVEVHEDPIEDVECGGCHSGIQGLHRKHGHKKLVYKDTKEKLRLLCDLHPNHKKQSINKD